VAYDQPNADLGALSEESDLKLLDRSPLLGTSGPWIREEVVPLTHRFSALLLTLPVTRGTSSSE
jgi:hypothetical protein